MLRPNDLEDPSIMFGRAVYSVCGPGDEPEPGMCERMGEVVGLHHPPRKYAECPTEWLIEWNDGTKENIGGLMEVGKDTGIGVYYRTYRKE